MFHWDLASLVFQVVAIPMLKIDRPGLLVKGSSSAIQNVLPKLQEFVTSIIISEHLIDTPGMPMYFGSDKGRNWFLFSIVVVNVSVVGTI